MMWRKLSLDSPRVPAPRWLCAWIDSLVFLFFTHTRTFILHHIVGVSADLVSPTSNWIRPRSYYFTCSLDWNYSYLNRYNWILRYLENGGSFGTYLLALRGMAWQIGHRIIQDHGKRKFARRIAAGQRRWSRGEVKMAAGYRIEGCLHLPCHTHHAGIHP